MVTRVLRCVSLQHAPILYYNNYLCLLFTTLNLLLEVFVGFDIKQYVAVTLCFR